MTGIMISHQRGTGDVTLGTVSTGGAAVTSIGSKVRDAHATLIANSESTYGPSHRTIQNNNKVFILYRNTATKLAISEFSPDAQSLILAADPAGGGTPLPVAGETVTQAVSGATGVTLEDYVAGDDYINIKSVTGTFDTTNSCTFSTATSSTTPTSVEDNGGEFFRRLESSDTLEQIDSFTGGHHYLDSNNDLNFSTFYMSPTASYGVKYASATDTFSETAALTGALGCAAMGSSVGFKNTIYFKYVWSVSRVVGVYNPISDALVVTVAGSAQSTAFATISVQSPFAITNGRVYTAEWGHNGGFSNIGQCVLNEVTGGTVTQKFLYQDVTGILYPARTTWIWIGKTDNAIYTCFEEDSIVKQVDRFYFDDLGVLQKNTEFFNTPTNRFALNILPASLSDGNTNSVCYPFRNNEDDQLDPTYLVHVGSATGDYSQYNLETWTDLDSGLTATFNNTIGNANDVVFQNTVAGVLNVGDVIRNNTTNRIYEVAAVSTTDVQIASFLNAGGDATATDSAVSKMTPWAFVAAATGTAGMCMPADNRGGYTYAVGEHTSELVTRVGLAGKERFTFTLHSDSGTQAVKVSFFYRLNDGVDRQCTISNPSVGSIVSNENTGLTADNTTNYELTWDQNTDSVGSGTAVEFFIKVEAV